MAARKPKFRSCRIAQLPDELRDDAVRTAIEENPANAAGVAIFAAARTYLPDVGELSALAALPSPERIYGLTNYLWRPGTTMPVYFLDNPDAETRQKILYWMNEWNRVGGNLPYVETRTLGDAIVRIDRDSGEGFYSYLGTQNKNVPRSQKTMNLAAFTAKTPESEYRRVVCHEAGHERGYGHEHFRKSVQERLKREQVIRRMMREQGWTRQMVIEQVFPDLDENTITADLTEAELNSVMMYPFSREDTIDGQGIPGGDHITVRDAAFDRKLFGAGGEPAKPVPDGLTIGGSITDSIARRGEVDYFPVKIDAAGVYIFRTEPAMAMGLYDAGRKRLLAPSVYGPEVLHTELTVRLEAGLFVLGVKHHHSRGIGPYKVSCEKI